MKSKPDQVLDLHRGVFSGESAITRRTLGELAQIFTAGSLIATGDTRIVYEVHGAHWDVSEEARLLYATTILHPGDVSGEYFMTRGHFHSRPDRGEFMLTLSGEGTLVLMDRERNTWIEPMRAGSVHDIDGAHAHRVANTSSGPLAFLVVWMSDCGHDYANIREHGFSKLLVKGPDGPLLIDRPA